MVDHLQRVASFMMEGMTKQQEQQNKLLPSFSSPMQSLASLSSPMQSPRMQLSTGEFALVSAQRTQQLTNGSPGRVVTVPVEARALGSADAMSKSDYAAVVEAESTLARVSCADSAVEVSNGATGADSPVEVSNGAAAPPLF